MPDTKERFRTFGKMFFITGNAIFGQGRSWYYILYAWTCRSVVCLNWLAMMVDACMHLGDLGHIIENVATLLPHLCGIWIDVFLRFRRPAIERLIYHTDEFVWEDWPARDEITGSLTMAGLFPRIQKVIRVLVLVIWGPHGVYMVYRGIMDRELLGFNAWFPFDTFSSPTHEIVILIQVYCSFALTTNFLANLGLYASLLTVACTQLTKVQNGLIQLGNNDLTGRKGDKGKGLSDCIDLHQRTLNFMYAIQDTLNPLMFGHFLVMLVGFAFACFGAVMSLGNVGALYEIIVVFNGQMMLLAAYCLFGTELSTQAEEVKFAAYSCDWTGCSLSEQKSLMFIMAVASKEFIITAGGVIPVNRETMLAVMNQAFSYTMFLLNFKDT